MELIPISSSNLSAVGYDEGPMTLQVQFKNGATYSYANVEPETYAAMMAGDPGEYFATIIKPQRQRYAFTRIV